MVGSLITLGIERVEIDWAKNCFGRNHSRLFLPSDLKDVTYYYAADVTERKPAYARSLRSIVKRLDGGSVIWPKAVGLMKNLSRKDSLRLIASCWLLKVHQTQVF